MSKVYLVSRSVYEYEDIYSDKDMAFSSRKKAIAKVKEFYDKDKEAQIKAIQKGIEHKKQELEREEKEYKEKGYDKHLDSDGFKERFNRFTNDNRTSPFFASLFFADDRGVLTEEDKDAIRSKQIIFHDKERIAMLEQVLDNVKHEKFEGKSYYFDYEGLTKSCKIRELELM